MFSILTKKNKIIMKYLKKFNEENTPKVDFDVNLAISKIEEHFPEDKINGMFDNEILEWVDEDWQDEYESEYDYYIDHNNGEAQDVIIDEIVNWYEKEFGEITKEQKFELIDEIKGTYYILEF